VTTNASVGIIGLGAYLPPDVRRNDWWDPAVVAEWSSARAAQVAEARHAGAALTPGMQAVLDAMATVRGDPFQGALQRHVMPAEMTALEMEERAAVAALDHAAIDRSQIDLLFTHTPVPEYLLSNTACLLHHRLALSSACFAMGTEASANSFLLQLCLAVAMIRAGQARNALLVQSCSVTRLLDPRSPLSPLFGDGATALVVGQVRPGRGVLAVEHRTDGSRNATLVATVKGRRWYDDGAVTLETADLDGARRVFLETADRGRDVVDAVLARTGVEPGAIDYYGVHQGTPWLRRVTQKHFGLEHARSIDTFAVTGYLFAASIPLGLAMSSREGLLRDGDLAVLFSGGTGVTYGAMAMRWGR
jgi:3-oxoacyl-[acyl-carrier-protein] synthase-3